LKTILVYGATGYTGVLIAEAAAACGVAVVLAGRRQAAIEALARRCNLPAKVFGLDNHAEIVAQLRLVHTVIHCAGPFSTTAKPMMEACIDAGTHYTDITGEWEVFLLAAEYDERARKAGVVLCPGVGFDVIPTDCLAWAIRERLPDATELHIAVDAALVLSPGSTKTLIESFKRDDGIEQRGGTLRRGVVKPQVREAAFSSGKKIIISMPLGDLAAIAHSSKVASVDVYHALSPAGIKSMQKLNRVKPLLRLSLMQKLLKWYVGRSVKGPDADRRESLPAHLWGEATNAAGEKVSARITTPNGYTVTVDGALAVAKLLDGYSGSGGYCTPAMLGGTELLTNLSGVSVLEFLEAGE
jgi:short subunit dehydrogenase-like uncharacterized protein